MFEWHSWYRKFLFLLKLRISCVSLARGSALVEFLGQADGGIFETQWNFGIFGSQWNFGIFLEFTGTYEILAGFLKINWNLMELSIVFDSIGEFYVLETEQ